MSGFEFDAPKQAGVNKHARVDCRTCNGDRMVVFSVRTVTPTGWTELHGLKPQGTVEEYAPCPDCNPNCDTRRQGFHSPDPARVRERLARQ